MLGCSNKILGNNAVFASAHLPYSNGKATKVYIKELASVSFVVKTKISVKYVL